jgi:bifunctional DNA-binding transcriptional regulator/antitoxin component of YhaV-PrlF toxin-antitoxin module
VAAQSKVSKGNLTVVPKDVRVATGIHEGDILTWRLEGGKLLVERRRPRTLKDIIGIAPHGGDAVEHKRAVQRTGHALR